MRHTNDRLGGGSVADEPAASDLLLGNSKGAHVGALETRAALHEIRKLFDRPHNSIH